MSKLNVHHLWRKCAVLTAVVVVAFLCGWSATSLTGGVVMALALGAGCAVPVFREDGEGCVPRLRRRQSSPRDP